MPALGQFLRQVWSRLPGAVRHALGYLFGYGCLIGAILVRQTDLQDNAPGWYVALGIMLLPTIVLFRWLSRKARPVAIASAALAANTTGLLVFFALAHKMNGFVDHPPPIPFGTALYFSVVTWTTLGYGDFQPVRDLQLLAASEALIGYVYLGLLVALIAKLLKL